MHAVQPQRGPSTGGFLLPRTRAVNTRSAWRLTTFERAVVFPSLFHDGRAQWRGEPRAGQGCASDYAQTRQGWQDRRSRREAAVAIIWRTRFRPPKRSLEEEHGD